MSQCPSCGGDCGHTKANGCNYASVIMRKEPEPKETYGFEEWQVLALRAGWICPTPKTEPISDAEIFDIAGNYDCGTNGENMEWTFKSQKELLDFSRALLEKAR